MAKDIIDDRLIGALHLLTLTREGLSLDEHTERTVIQAGTINALLDGKYEGDITIGELLALGSDGIGTTQGLDGELIILDGAAFSARADGSVAVVTPETKTPFAVLTRFETTKAIDVTEMQFDNFLNHIDCISGNTPVVAIKARGAFKNLHLRSVEKQLPPYRPLIEIVADQTEWHFKETDGDLIGFQFPDTIAGVEVPGWHLHFISKDRLHGGHVISLDVVSAHIELSDCDQLHVELPSGSKLGEIGDGDRSAINAIEGR